MISEQFSLHMAEYARYLLENPKKHPFKVTFGNGAEIYLKKIQTHSVQWNQEKQRFEPREDSWKKQLKL